MKWKTVGGLFLLSLALAGCGAKKQKESQVEEKRVVTQSVSTSSTEEKTSTVASSVSDSTRAIANEFIYAYVTQELDLTSIENRKSTLLNLLSEEEVNSSILIQYLDSLKFEVESWEKEGRPDPSGGTFLQEREISNLTLYQDQNKFLAKVDYKQTTAGQPSQILQQYVEFEVVENHVQKIKVMTN